MPPDESSCDDHEVWLFQDDPFYWLSERFPDGKKRQEFLQSILTDVPITANMANGVKDKVRNLVEEEFHLFYPEVIISYSTGCRKDKDVECAGPGLMIAVGVIKHLFDAGCPCYSDIMTPEGKDWREYMLRVKKAKVMIVMMSTTFFCSVHCLLEVAAAVKYGVELIPVRCEERSYDISRNAEAMWPIEELQNYAKQKANPLKVLEDLEDKRRRVVDLLTTINSLPAHSTILNEPTALERLAARVRELAPGVLMKNGINSQSSVPDKNSLTKLSRTTQSSSQHESSKAGAYEIMGVDFHFISKSKWKDYVIENKEILEGKLLSMLEYGELCEGQPYMTLKRVRRDDGAERVVVRLNCGVEIRRDLQSHKYARVREICRQIARKLEEAGVDDRDLREMMIGTAWMGSLMLLLEAPSRVIKRLFSLFLRAQQCFYLEDTIISGIAPALLVKFKSDVLENYIEQRDQGNWPDVVAWMEGDIVLLIPSCSDELNKLRSGGVRFWPHGTHEDFQFIAKTHTKEDTPENVYEIIIRSLLRSNRANASDFRLWALQKALANTRFLDLPLPSGTQQVSLTKKPNLASGYGGNSSITKPISKPISIGRKYMRRVDSLLMPLQNTSSRSGLPSLDGFTEYSSSAFSSEEGQVAPLISRMHSSHQDIPTAQIIGRLRSPVETEVADTCNKLGNEAFIEANRVSIARARGIEAVISAMKRYSDSPTVQKGACRILGNLAFTFSNLGRIAHQGGITTIVRAMKLHPGSLAVQQNACQALTNLASNDVHRMIIFNAGGAVTIVNAMKRYADNSTLQNQACQALAKLARGVNINKRESIIEAGGITAVVDAMKLNADNADVLQSSCWVLYNIALAGDHGADIVEAGGIASIVNAMEGHSENGDVQLQACQVLVTIAEQNSDIAEADSATAIVNAMKMHADHQALQEWSCWALCLLSRTETNAPIMGLVKNMRIVLVTAASKFPDTCEKNVLETLGNIMLETRR